MASLADALQAGVATAEDDIQAIRNEDQLITQFIENFLAKLPSGFFEAFGCSLEVVPEGLQLVSSESNEPFAACLFDPRTLQFLFELPLGEVRYPLPANEDMHDVLAKYLGIAAARQKAYEASNYNERFRPELRLKRATFEK